MYDLYLWIIMRAYRILRYIFGGSYRIPKLNPHSFIGCVFEIVNRVVFFKICCRFKHINRNLK